MSDEQQDERALARMARASQGSALRGARRYVDNARAWVRAEGLEALIRERDAHRLAARAAQDARAHARSRRARTSTSAPPRALTDIEVRARALGTRAVRSALALALPGALVIYPPYALIHGDALPLALWPAAYGYLVWDGFMFRERDADDGAAADDEDTDADTDKSKQGMLRAIFNRTRTPGGLEPTRDESAIMRRIETWEDRAAARRLHEVYPGPPIIDESGLLVPLTFGGQWTPGKLDAQIDQFRSLLAVADDVRTQIKPGGTADRALLRVRTRIRDLDLSWAPEIVGFGLDADTGEVVYIDVTDRILVAGMSGAGKSVALRVLMAAALALPHTQLVIIDLKVEGALWSHVARVESEAEGIRQLVQELTEEMREREAIMRAQSLDKWIPTAERPRIVVAVDEGAELISEVEDCIPGLRSIARRARSAEIVLWWSTQKPTVTGQGRGLDSAISAQLTSLISLAVSSAAEARNVLGEDATGKGWHAEDLQKGGWSLVRVQGGDRAPDPVRVFYMTKEDVRALPARETWRRESSTPADRHDVLAVALRLSEGLQGVATARIAATMGITADEVHRRMSAYGAKPEPNAFSMGNGEKARGYRRSVLEAAEKDR